ncbi:hypothetical protein CQW49_20910 [Methylosinus trichosporium OB3b]|uniref:Uncharacterized protein n=1 Tax=Methylosinus trichosporium (strain ATCC 35070 / NCIMB 11131 / UNIQEM 75 / OB3b) TaxID=595536 RepID=A0A2D2D693_METT3|nr:hypothetical protein CQW49_20910 [Methylosinus trichosporium OB3b]
MFAFVLPLVIGVCSLVVEFGNALLIKARYQRVADIASFSGALAYSGTSSTTTMTNASVAVAALNQVPAAAVSANLTVSPASSSNSAVLVAISAAHPLFLTPVLNGPRSLQIAASAYSQIAVSASSCLLALDSSKSGVTLSGGTSVTATSCVVASNSSVTVPCGTSIAAKAVDYYSSSAPSAPCSGISGSIVKAYTTDPVAGTSGLTTATARLTTVAAQTAPSAPSVSTGSNVSFGYTAASMSIGNGCTATTSSAYSGKWTVTCPAGGTYTFGAITTSATLSFATSGTAATTYNFSGVVTLSGTNSFGPGIYNFAKGIVTSGGSVTTFAAGSTFNIGQSTTYCSNGYYSICNTATLTISGPASFKLSAGVANTGGSSLTLGYGSGITGNNFQIGPGSTGDAINLGGGSTTLMGDATASGSLFRLNGNLNDAGGGSCLVISAADQHDIEGNFIASGAVVMGAGVYTVDGYMALGGAGGGGATCNGATVSVTGVDVTTVLSGKSTPSSGSCSGLVFCVAAGYSNIVMTAPTSGTYAKLAVIGPTSSAVTAGASFIQGGSNGQITGIFYVPYGPLTMSGGAGLSGGSSCLQLIASSITLSGGSVLGSACVSSGGSSTATLVQ